MGSILSLIPIPWRIVGGVIISLVFGATYGLGFWKGYGLGYDSAENKFRSQIAELQAEYNSRAAKAAQDFQAELVKKTEQALEAGAQFHMEKEAHANIENNLQARIDAYLAGEQKDIKDQGKGKNVNHFSVRRIYSPEFVRLYNEAIGAATPDSNAAENTYPAGAFGPP